MKVTTFVQTKNVNTTGKSNPPLSVWKALEDRRVLGFNTDLDTLRKIFPHGKTAKEWEAIGSF